MMAGLKNTVHVVVVQILVALWIWFIPACQAYTYTTCIRSQYYGGYTVTRKCTNIMSTDCCNGYCCNVYGSCYSTYNSYQYCQNLFATDCCSKRLGYSTCCSSTDWTDITVRNTASPALTVVGAVVGAVIVVIIIIVVVVVMCCRRQGSRGRVLQPRPGTYPTQGTPMVAGAVPPVAATTQPYQPQQPAAYPQQQYPQPYPPGPQVGYGGAPYQQAPAPYPTGVQSPPPSYDNVMGGQQQASAPYPNPPYPHEKPSAPSY